MKAKPLLGGFIFLSLLLVWALTGRHIPLTKSLAVGVKAPANGAQRQDPNPKKSVASAASAALLEGYGRLPLAFEANRGQSDPHVKFISRGSGYALFLTSNETVLLLRRGATAEDKKFPETGPRRDALAQPAELNQRFDPARRGRGKEAALRMRLVGADSAARPAGFEKLPGKLNYLVGNDRSKWRTDVPTFAGVRYENVYPGVDLVYHGDHRQLEYDFIVAPGATPDVIRMSFGGLAAEHGAIVPKVDGNGDLTLHTSAGDVAMRLPFVYQQIGDARQQVSCRYALLGNDQVGFRLGAYDRSRPLIIDPVLIYSTYLGDLGGANGIAVDALESVYIVGETQSADFPTTSGTLQSGLKGTANAFITKLSADGKSLIYSTYQGGSDVDYANGIAVDSSGDAYITGSAFSTDFPTTFGGFPDFEQER